MVHPSLCVVPRLPETGGELRHRVNLSRAGNISFRPFGDGLAMYHGHGGYLQNICLRNAGRTLFFLFIYIYIFFLLLFQILSLQLFTSLRSTNPRLNTYSRKRQPPPQQRDQTVHQYLNPDLSRAPVSMRGAFPFWILFLQGFQRPKDWSRWRHHPQV